MDNANGLNFLVLFHNATRLLKKPNLYLKSKIYVGHEC